MQGSRLVTDLRREPAGRDRSPPGDGDPDQRLALPGHRRAVLVPVRVLAADRPVVVDQGLQRFRQVQHFRLPVDLHPRPVPVVGEHAQRDGRIAPQVGHLRPLRIGGDHDPAGVVDPAGDWGELRAAGGPAGGPNGGGGGGRRVTSTAWWRGRRNSSRAARSTRSAVAVLGMPRRYGVPVTGAPEHERSGRSTLRRGTMGMPRPRGGLWQRRRCRAHRRFTVVQRPEELVELLPGAQPFLDREADADAAAGGQRRGLVLVHDLAGEFDAAHAGALAGSHLLASLPHEVLARFDVDSLVDYRAHRPRITFTGDRYESFTAPEIVLYAVEDDAGQPFLLLHGVEPDYAWERFVAAVGMLVDRLGLTSLVGLAASPLP